MRYIKLLTLISLILMGGAGMPSENASDATIRIQRDTEKYRKSKAVVHVVDRKGRAVEGVSVKAEQTTHDFLFGCNIYTFDAFPSPEENAKHKELFKRIMNYATLPFYWRSFEREQGKPGYERSDNMAKWCKENGIITKGHPLIWTNESGIPTWLPQDKPDEVRRLIEARVREIVTRDKGMIDIWDVVNESTHTPPFANMSVFDYTSEPVRWARETNPNAMLLVNEFDIIGDTKGDRPYFKLLQQMNASGVPFDAIGIQTHMHGGVLPIPVLLETLDKYAELGKPLHLTETTVLSGLETTSPADEKKQAEYTEQFYRACFSHPAVRAITWWDFSDFRSWQRVAAGLVRKDLSPKPVYMVLDRMINKEWHTSADGRTNAEGSFTFRGFHGKYRVTVTGPSGETKVLDFHLAEGKNNRFSARL